jgi:hypothetical protein
MREPAPSGAGSFLFYMRLPVVSEAAKTLLLWALIAVWMTVPPIPVVPLRSVMLPVILHISPVPFYQVTPVGAVFVVIPVMVITVVPIVDAHLHAGVLRSGAGHDCGWRSNGRSQE